MGLRADEYAVLVAAGRSERNWGLGHARINEAPILLTTHAMIDRRMLGKASWADASEFHYQGQPRKLRVWDESILPGIPICIPELSLYLLMGLKIGPDALREEIKTLAANIAKAPNQQLVMIPEFADKYDLQDARGTLSASDRAKVADTLDNLWRLSGKSARVICDGNSGNTLIQYETHLPSDMLPMLILDASARVRTTYKIQAKYAKNVEWLKETRKRYEAVTIHVKEVGAGKRSFGYPPMVTNRWRVTIELLGASARAGDSLAPRRHGCGRTSLRLQRRPIPEFSRCRWQR